MSNFLTSVNKAIFITKEGRSISVNLYDAITDEHEQFPVDVEAAFEAAGISVDAITVE